MSDGAGIENGEERNRQNWAQTKALPPRVVKRITNIQQHHKRVVKPSTNGTQTDASSVKNSAENSDTQHHLWAGAVAGMVADSIMHPFDTLSTRIKVQDGVGQDVKYKGLLQTTRTIAAEEGLLALYGGLSAAMLSTIPSTALYFATYEAVKKEGCKHVPESGAPVVHFVAGAMSELTSLTVAVPFEVIKCRMQLGSNPSKVTNGAVPLTSNYHSAFHGLATVWKNEGIRGLYAGLRPCIILDCCFSAIQFALYEQTRKQMTIRREAVVAGDSPATWPPPWSELGDDLVCGSISGGFAALLTNPLDVATTRIMTQVDIPGSCTDSVRQRVRYMGTWHCLKSMVANEGMRSLWYGSSARVLSIFPLSGLTFSVYENMKRILKMSDG